MMSAKGRTAVYQTCWKCQISRKTQQDKNSSWVQVAKSSIKQILQKITQQRFRAVRSLPKQDFFDAWPWIMRQAPLRVKRRAIVQTQSLQCSKCYLLLPNVVSEKHENVTRPDRLQVVHPTWMNRQLVTRLHISITIDMHSLDFWCISIGLCCSCFSVRIVYRWIVISMCVHEKKWCHAYETSYTHSNNCPN